MTIKSVLFYDILLSTARIVHCAFHCGFLEALQSAADIKRKIQSEVQKLNTKLQNLWMKILSCRASALAVEA
jgi:hypothetical protein